MIEFNISSLFWLAMGGVIWGIIEALSEEEGEDAEKAIRGMLYRLYKTENQDKIRSIIKEGRA